jgi:uncharacterized membrane protein
LVRPRTGRLAISGFVLLCAAIYANTHVFSGRGAFIQVGALVGSIMAANVLVITIPGQRKTVAALLNGEEPKPVWGQMAKQRSMHNNYLTLPVVFTMLSNHYSFTCASLRWSWLILACLFIACSWCGTGSTPNTPVLNRTGGCGRPRRFPWQSRLPSV